MTFYDIESTNLNANYGYILCIGWKHLGDKKVHCASIDQSPGFKKDPTNDAWVVKTFAEEISKSDIICGWYSSKFDWPFIQSRLLAHELSTMPSIPHVDLWRTAKYQLKLNSNRLASVSEFLNLEEKTPIRSREWIRAMAGHRPAIKYVVDHCLSPDYRVLTQGLQWRKLGDLTIGDQLIGVEETSSSYGARRFVRSAVEEVRFDKVPCLRVVLGTGEDFICTPEHLWLTNREGGTMGWVRTDRLRTTKAGQLRSKVTRLVPVAVPDQSYGAGWLAGFLDGEGCVGRHADISASQKPGRTLEQAVRISTEIGAKFGLDVVVDRDRPVNQLRFRGSFGHKLAFLSAVRPERLIANLNPDNFGHIKRGSSYQKTWIEAVEPAGDREIAVVNTSSRTFICEGYPMHNCIQDIRVLEAAYLKMRPVMKGHPNVNLVSGDLDEAGCPICGSKKLQKRGRSVAGVGFAQRYHCQSCGGWSRGRPQRMDVEVR